MHRLLLPHRERVLRHKARSREAGDQSRSGDPGPILRQDNFLFPLSLRTPKCPEILETPPQFLATRTPPAVSRSGFGCVGDARRRQGWDCGLYLFMMAIFSIFIFLFIFFEKSDGDVRQTCRNSFEFPTCILGLVSKIHENTYTNPI